MEPRLELVSICSIATWLAIRLPMFFLEKGYQSSITTYQSPRNNDRWIQKLSVKIRTASQPRTRRSFHHPSQQHLWMHAAQRRRNPLLAVRLNLWHAHFFGRTTKKFYVERLHQRSRRKQHSSKKMFVTRFFHNAQQTYMFPVHLAHGKHFFPTERYSSAIVSLAVPFVVH
jgi:hypothetical protein